MNKNIELAKKLLESKGYKVSRVNESEYTDMVYHFRIPWRQKIYIDYDVEYEYNPRYMTYKKEIQSQAMRDFNESDIAQYTGGDSRTKDLDIHKMTMSFNTQDECIIDVQTSLKLSESQISDLISYLTGQLSDGWGEGFEQRVIDHWTEDRGDYDAEYFVHGQFWWNTKKHDWSIDLIGVSSMTSRE